MVQNHLVPRLLVVLVTLSSTLMNLLETAGHLLQAMT